MTPAQEAALIAFGLLLPVACGLIEGVPMGFWSDLSLAVFGI